MRSIHEILKTYWGFDAFRPLQEEIIRSVLDGNDTLALLPTGGGKSVCFQVPALAMDGLCLVVSPLIALMKDQVQNLNKKGIKAVAVYSGMSYRQIDTALDSCVYGNVKFLYLSPERLLTDEFQARMTKMNISLLAVDEAHCISQWGYDFRPPYLKIAEVRNTLSKLSVIALTATATPQVAKDIQDKLNFKRENIFQKSFVRSNLSYVVRSTRDKNRSLLEILQKVGGSGVVYVRNRRRTKELAEMLTRSGIKSDFYHAGLSTDERAIRQDKWMRGSTRVICCTNAFGMGIDKPDVRTVVHMDVAENIESYFQEAGRAGRDEKKAYAVQLLDSADIVELDKKISEGYPGVEFVRELYEALCIHFKIALNSGQFQSFDFDVLGFAEKLKTTLQKVIQSIKLLEQEEILSLTESFFSSSQVKAVASYEAMHRFQVENKKFEPLIKFILRTSEGVFDNYVSIDEQTIASRIKIPVAEVIGQLQMLNRFQVFSYQPRKQMPQITFLGNRVAKRDLRLNTEFIKQREVEYVHRLKSVRAYITSATVCRTRMLVSYFGEKQAHDCGICDVCVEQRKKVLSAEKFDELLKVVESELTKTPLKADALKNKLQIKTDDLNLVLDYLSDAGRIEHVATGEISLKR